YVFAAYLIIFGLVYLFSPTLMPYHQKFLGIAYEELDPKMAFLSLASMKVIGSLALSMGIGFVMIIKFQLCRGDAWARWIILIMSLVALVPILFITLRIGLYTPWWTIAVSIIVMSVAVIISKTSPDNKCR
ncbi:MAG: hypothetical protein JRC53_04885, partial [Deltaproteobacteria bacterium]|nr:hypothetical protein [Deltaproteobacteria bacterium]